MKFSTTTLCTLTITSLSCGDIYQYSDCDNNGTLLLTTETAEPYVDLSNLYLGRT
jgi:hypothetical protein